MPGPSAGRAPFVPCGGPRRLGTRQPESVEIVSFRDTGQSPRFPAFAMVRGVTTSGARGRRRRSTSRRKEPPAAPEVVVDIEPPDIAVEDAVGELPVEVVDPEPAFAARVPPPEAERPRPATRRAIFFDVENSSRVEHAAHMLQHLRLDRAAQGTELVAVGNWRVINHDTARLLARYGAHLVHSAPSVGVRDWSDLRI